MLNVKACETTDNGPRRDVRAAITKTNPFEYTLYDQKRIYLFCELCYMRSSECMGNKNFGSLLFKISIEHHTCKVMKRKTNKRKEKNF